MAVDKERLLDRGLGVLPGGLEKDYKGDILKK